MIEIEQEKHDKLKVELNDLVSALGNNAQILLHEEIMNI